MKRNFKNMDAKTRLLLNSLVSNVRFAHEKCDSYQVGILNNGSREVYEHLCKVDAYRFFGNYFKENGYRMVDVWKRGSTLVAKADKSGIYVAVNCFFD